MKLILKCVEIRTRLVKTGPIGDLGYPVYGLTVMDTYKESTDVGFIIKDGRNNINFYLPDRIKNEFILGKSYELEVKEIKDATKSKK